MAGGIAALTLRRCAVAGLRAPRRGTDLLAPTRCRAATVSRLQITPSDAASRHVSTDDHNLAITPDGSRLIYVGDRGRQLFVRALDDLEPVSVFTGAPRGPIRLSRWPVDRIRGHAARVEEDRHDGRAGRDRGDARRPHRTAAPHGDRMTRLSSRPTNPGNRPAAGLSVRWTDDTVLTRPDREQGEADHAWPEWLPGGRAVLFTVMAVTGGPDATQVAVLNLRTGDAHKCSCAAAVTPTTHRAVISSMRRPAHCGRCRSIRRGWRPAARRWRSFVTW